MRIMLQILVTIQLLCVTSCYLQPPVPEWDVDGIPDLSGESVEYIMLVVASSVQYKRDKVDDWQAPGVTYRTGRGDCEDFAILAVYLIDTYTNSAVYFVRGDRHAWVIIDGEHWEPQLSWKRAEEEYYYAADLEKLRSFFE